MKKWEYHLIMHSFKYGEIDKNHVRELNLLGQAGWDLVSVTRIHEDPAQYSFKRPVEQRILPQQQPLRLAAVRPAAARRRHRQRRRSVEDGEDAALKVAPRRQQRAAAPRVVQVGEPVGEARPEVAVYARGQSASEFKHRRVADENNYLLMQNFADALDHDTELIVDARAARDIAAIVQAALASAQSGSPVDITR